MWIPGQVDGEKEYWEEELEHAAAPIDTGRAVDVVGGRRRDLFSVRFPLETDSSGSDILVQRNSGSSLISTTGGILREAEVGGSVHGDVGCVEPGYTGQDQGQGRGCNVGFGTWPKSFLREYWGVLFN